MMKEIEDELAGVAKLNVVDLYKGKSLCDRLDCNAEPMKIFFTKNGEIAGNTMDCSKNHIIKKIKELSAE